MKFDAPKQGVMMSHIFASHRTVKALEAIGADRTIHLIDNSFNADLADWARVRPFVHYIRMKMDRVVEPAKVGGGPAVYSRMRWCPRTLSSSWNLAISGCETEWIINVNPDTLVHAEITLGMLERFLDSQPEEVVLMRTQLNFNLWAGRVEFLREHPFDIRYSPCAGEDEDMLVQIAEDESKWMKCQVPAFHMDGGHKDRVDMGMNGHTYPNAEVFEAKWGFAPQSPEFKKIVGGAFWGNQ